MLKGGGTTSFEVVLTQELKILAIVMERGATILDPQFSHCVASTSP